MADTTMPLVHLYRGELQRMTSYRVRLDTTTNWAVGTTAAVVSFVLGNQNTPHFVLGIALLLNLAFVHLEARRFQRFEMIRERVRLLECGLYGEMLGGQPDPSWKDSLRMLLQRPQSPMPWWRALGLRVRRNYVWVFSALYLAWWAALHISGRPFLEAARVGTLSGAWTLAALALLAAALLSVALFAGPSEVDPTAGEAS